MPTRMIGLVPAAFGVLTTLAVIATAGDSGIENTWMDWVSGPAFIALGVGLLLSQRWAWALAALVGIAGVVAGVMAFTSPGDIAFPATQLLGSVFLLIPGLAILVALFNPPTVRWLLRREGGGAPDEVPARPDSL